MSAYVISEEHVTAMVRAGLTVYRGRISGLDLSWHAEDVQYEGAATHDEYVQQLQAAYRQLNANTADQTASMLMFECIRSVAYRYQDCEWPDLPGPIPNPNPSSIHVYPLEKAPSPVQALKLVDCYEYQSCEHPDWDSSEAKRFCAALRSALIGSLPGYDDAPWEWDQEAVNS